MTNPAESEKSVYRQWEFSAGHSVFIDAIEREMEGYTSLYAEIMEKIGHEPSYQPALEERRVVVIMLVAGYIEALINLYCSFRLDPKQLDAMDRLPIPEKWSAVPSFCEPSYQLDKSRELYNDLRNLIKCRNAIVHMRPQFKVGGEIVHHGNGAPLEAVSHDSLMKWISLPLRLAQNLKKYDKSDDGQRLYFVSDVHSLSRDWNVRLQFHCKREREKNDLDRPIKKG